MIEDLKPYPEYKQSELPWLGEVPTHWQVLRIKTVLREIDSRSEEGTETLLSLTRIRGLIPHRNMTEKMHGAKTLVGYKRYRAGQLVMNRMQAWSGMFGAGKIDELVSPDYAVFDVLGQYSAQFILERVKSPDLVGQFALESKGIGSGFNRLYTDRFGQIAISLPPPEEQAAIARFLAWATNRLDRAIGAKRRIIALLQEQKQAIIHRAVTRGLDPSVPLKDSGISWLGEIPEHWEVITIGAISELLQTGPFGSQLHQSDYVTGGIPVINPSHLSDGRISHSSGVTIKPEKAAALFRHRLRPNDILIARRGDLGRCAVATALEEGWICGTGSLLLRCKLNIIKPNFLQIVFSSRGMCQMLELSSIGATMANLNEGSVARQRIPLPPLAEQEGIVASIRIRSEIENAAITRLEHEITLLREYRTRLIADVVTGKLDVREVAKGLQQAGCPGGGEGVAGGGRAVHPVGCSWLRWRCSRG
jgi:type I restriction enzyme S subunit